MALTVVRVPVDIADVSDGGTEARKFDRVTRQLRDHVEIVLET